MFIVLSMGMEYKEDGKSIEEVVEMLRKEYKTKRVRINDVEVVFYKGKFDARVNYYYPTHFLILGKYLVEINGVYSRNSEREELDEKYNIALSVAKALKADADLSDVVPVVLYDINEYTKTEDIIEGTLPEE